MAGGEAVTVPVFYLSPGSGGVRRVSRWSHNAFPRVQH